MWNAWGRIFVVHKKKFLNKINWGRNAEKKWEELYDLSRVLKLKEKNFIENIVTTILLILNETHDMLDSL